MDPASRANSDVRVRGIARFPALEAHMNTELLSRFQFALTASFHYIYPPHLHGAGR